MFFGVFLYLCQHTKEQHTNIKETFSKHHINCKKMKKHIPNFITCLNILSGTIGIVYALDGNYTIALIAVMAAALFDFLDGLAARLLNAYSNMGKELDSICDVVSFGVLPSTMLYHALAQSEKIPFEYYPFLAFLITAFSALRLAKFNVDTRQSENFLGLAVPANALFWVGIVYSYKDFIAENPYTTLGAIAISCYLLVSEIPMFSLKVKNLVFKENWVVYIFIIGTIALIATKLSYSLPYIILWYIVMSGVRILSKKLK